MDDHDENCITTELSKTKLYYSQARYYDPQTARFISRDPDPGDEDDPITMNGYTYADDNPIMNRDPDGNWAWAVVNAGFAVYDGYKAYKAGKNKKQNAWAVASSFVGLRHVKKAGKALKLLSSGKYAKEVFQLVVLNEILMQKNDES